MPSPKFNTALRGVNVILEGKPPVRFEGVTVRVFPIRANMFRLRTFTESYLNVAPDIVRFRPAFPYVYLMAVNYGRMAAEFRNLGWVSQHEIVFAVPLECYRVDKGRLVFADWAAVCPFIYVDDEMSLSTGREVYGWPKFKVWLDPDLDPWVVNPRAPRHRPLRASTMVFPKVYAGQEQQARVLLEILHESPPAFSQFPPNLENPFNPLLSVPRALLESAAWFGELMAAATRLPILGYGPSPSLESLSRMVIGSARYLTVASLPPPFAEITLKQFRDAEHPARVCYQAIAKSGMQLERYNAAGLLGDLNLLRGDATGGFQIRIHRYTSQPIIESLGLEIAGQTTIEGSTVATLKPVVPFWLDVDMRYGEGTVICWRTKRSRWYVGPTRARPTAQADGAESRKGHPYNTALGAAVQDITGPFSFPNMTLRVLPLMARPERLKRFCEEYLANDFYRFEPWGSYVYMTVTSYGEMSSDTDPVGWWAGREVAISIPVRWCDCKGNLLSVGIVPAYVFADSDTAAITGREVTGLPTLSASLVSPAHTWMADSGPAAVTAKRLLTMKTMVLPALHQGQHAERRVVLEILEAGDSPHDLPVKSRLLADTWGRELLQEHRREIEVRRHRQTEFVNLKALALELLVNHRPINTITLKQFRDADEPDCACYQAIVRGQRVIDRIYTIEEIEDGVELMIHRYPSLPITQTLGLKAKWMDASGEVAVDIIQPIRPFWMKLGVRERLGENICSRAGTEVWERDWSTSLYFAEEGETKVGRGLARLADEEKRGLSGRTRAWLDGATKFGHDRLTRIEAAEAVKSGIDPQMVVESILSKEWENWSAPRWMTNTEKPDFCIPCNSVHGLLNLLPSPPPEDPVRNERNLTADKAWYSEEPKDWEPNAAWFSPRRGSRALRYMWSLVRGPG